MYETGTLVDAPGMGREPFWPHVSPLTPLHARLGPPSLALGVFMWALPICPDRSLDPRPALG